MEFIVEALFQLLYECVFQVFGDALVEMGLRSFDAAKREGFRKHPIFSGLAFAVLGALAGAILSLFLPERLVSGNPFPGISLVLSPICNGAVMEVYGRWRENRGVERTAMTTFWGGA